MEKNFGEKRSMSNEYIGRYVTYRIVSILHEGVDCKHSKVGLRLGVVDEVEIHQLLQLQIVCGVDKYEDNLQFQCKSEIELTGLDVVHNVREKRGDILAYSHVSDDL
jgi:hypothetical protein